MFISVAQGCLLELRKSIAPMKLRWMLQQMNEVCSYEIGNVVDMLEMGG